MGYGKRWHQPLLQQVMFPQWQSCHKALVQQVLQVVSFSLQLTPSFLQDRVAAEYFLGLKHVHIYHSYTSKHDIVISVCTQCITKQSESVFLKLNLVSCLV